MRMHMHMQVHVHVHVHVHVRTHTHATHLLAGRWRGLFVGRLPVLIDVRVAVGWSARGTTGHLPDGSRRFCGRVCLCA